MESDIAEWHALVLLLMASFGAIGLSVAVWWMSQWQTAQIEEQK